MRLHWLMLAGLLGGTAAQAQGYVYDAVVIRPNKTGSSSTHIDSSPGIYDSSNQSLKSLIQDAYGLQTLDQLVGLPGWASDARFDIKAKVDADTASRIKVMKHDEFEAAYHQAAQALLADRFGLKVHHELRELPEYALVQTKSGSKMTPGDEMSSNRGMHTSGYKMTANAVRLDMLTSFLSRQTHRPVVDKTGLTGKFDMTLTWTPDELANAAMDGAADKAPGLFTALQEQLGLKLEAIKGSVDTIVVDHVELPTEN